MQLKPGAKLWKRGVVVPNALSPRGRRAFETRKKVSPSCQKQYESEHAPSMEDLLTWGDAIEHLEVVQMY